jgi:hypothetical protein
LSKADKDASGRAANPKGRKSRIQKPQAQRRPRAQGHDDAHARRLRITDPQASVSTLKTFAVESGKPGVAEV